MDKPEDASVKNSLQLPTGPETVPESYAPEGFKTQAEYLDDLREDYALDIEADDHNRRAALDDKNFAAGNQWDPVVEQHRKGLPCLKINSIPQFTAQLVGDWRTNRNAVKVVPSENGDTEVASVRGDLIRAIEMKSRASRVYDNAFESQIQCGDGNFRVAVEYARDDVFDQEIYIRPIDDCLSVVWDRMSVDPTGRDATRVFVDDTLPKKEFEERWGEITPSELSTDVRHSCLTGGWLDADIVRVTEHWRMIERNRLLGLFENGKIIAIDGAKMDEIIEANGYPVKTRLAPCMYAQMHLVTGFKILAGPFEYKLNRVPVIRMSGRVINVGGKRIRHGLVRFMKDPVRLRNFWRSIAAEQLGYAPKAQWIAPEGAVEGREDDFRRAHLSRDPLLIYNDDAVAPPMRVEPPAIQAALLNEAAVNTQDMKDVTGIHDASLGIKSNETSGKAIMARQREGDIANLTYHDNGNAAILEAGDVINQLIPQIYDGTRIIRIIGEDEEPKFKKINDPYDSQAIDISVGNYDVALSTGTSYMTRRVEAAQAMMEAVQVWPEMMQVAGDLVAKAQDWPGADKLADRIKKTIPQHLLEEEDRDPNAPPAVTPQQIQQTMMELETLKQENAQLKQEHDIKLQKLEIDDYNAKTQRIKALSDHEVDAEAAQMNAIKMILDQDNNDNDREERRQAPTKEPSAKK